jgi:hypothetical protein
MPVRQLPVGMIFMYIPSPGHTPPSPVGNSTALMLPCQPDLLLQVYNCFTDMVEDASGTNVPMVEGRINVRFRRLQPDEDRSLATCNILVMEYCDRWVAQTLECSGLMHIAPTDDHMSGLQLCLQLSCMALWSGAPCCLGAGSCGRFC